MTVNEVTDILQAKRVSGDGDREITGIYTGDLLSWVISHAGPGDMWVTVMNNLNILAVASLTEAACIVVTDNSGVDREVVRRAEEQEITILVTEKSSAEVVWKVAKALGKI